MSHAASAFSSAFAKTLTEGIRYQEKREQERAELEIRKKLADASFAYHEAQTADLTSKLKSRAAFLQKYGPTGRPEIEDPAGGTYPGAPGTNVPDQQAIMGHMASQGESLAPLLREPKERRGPFVFNEAGRGNTDTGEFVPNPQAPETPLQAAARKRLEQAQGAPPAAAPAIPGPGQGGLAEDYTETVPADYQGQPGAPATLGGMTRTYPASEPEPTPQYGEPKYHMDAKGGVSVTLEVGKNTVTQTHETVGGRSVIVERIKNEVGRNVVKPRIIGEPIPPAEAQQISRAAEGYGYRPGTPEHALAVNYLERARTIPDPVTRQEWIKAIPNMVGSSVGQQGSAPAQPGSGQARRTGTGGTGGTGGGGSAPAVTDLASAERAGEARQVRQAAAETGARKRAEVENAPPGESRQREINAIKGLSRSATRLGENFEPEFGGKGLTADAVRAEYERAEAAIGWGSNKTVTAGAFFGWLREKTGNISPKEATFRRDVADVFDQMIRLRSGAAVGGEREYENIKASLFSLWDEPKVFLARLAVFKADLAGMEADIYTTGTKGAAQGAREAEARRGAANPVRPTPSQPQTGTRDSTGRPTIPGGRPRFTPDQVQKVVPVVP